MDDIRDCADRFGTLPSLRHSREGGNPYSVKSPENNELIRLRLQPMAEVYPERLPCGQSKGKNLEEGGDA